MRNADLIEHSSNDRALAWDRFANALCALMILASLAFAAFRFGIITSRGMTIDRSLFSAMNAVTLTGFEQSYASIRSSPANGLLVLMVLTIASASVIGGTGAALVFQLLGVRTSLWKLWLGSAGVYVLFAMAGGSMRNAFDNVSAITLSGFFIRDQTDPSSPFTLFWRLPIVIIGSIGIVGFSAIFRIIRLPDARAIVFRLIGYIALAYLFCFAINLTLMPSIAESNAWAINSRSAGLPIGSLRDLSAPARWVVMFQSMIGAMPGSTSGGLSVLPIALALGGLMRGLRGGNVGHAASISLFWIGAMIALIGSLTIMLVALEAQLSGEQALFLSIASLMNSGLSQDPLGLTGAPLIVLGIVTFLGRMISLAMLAWLIGSGLPDREITSCSSIQSQ